MVFLLKRIGVFAVTLLLASIAVFAVNPGTGEPRLVATMLATMIRQ